MCGDSTVVADVERLLGGANVDSIVYRPALFKRWFPGVRTARLAARGLLPYTNQFEMTASATRGYQALIKGTLALVPISVSVVYVFTDWRMWVNLFDVVEACGYGVRSMIVLE